LVPRFDWKKAADFGLTGLRHRFGIIGFPFSILFFHSLSHLVLSPSVPLRSGR
jgi:hypothetical protein